MDKLETIKKSTEIGALLGPLDQSNLWDIAIESVPIGGLVIEVGSWTGGSAVILGEVCKLRNARMICIDPYGGDMFAAAPTQPTVLEIFLANTRGLPIDCIVADSVNAVGYLKDQLADLIFIDGDHAMPRVYDDIAIYWDKLTSGGTYILHDYSNPCDVKKAADQFFESIGVQTVQRENALLKVVKP